MTDVLLNDIPRLVTQGLVARYPCDDAISGSSITTVRDLAGSWPLTATGHTWTTTGITFTGSNTSYASNSSFTPPFVTACTFMLALNLPTPDTASINYCCGLGQGSTVRMSAFAGGNVNLPPAKTFGLYDGVNLDLGSANDYENTADGGVWRTIAGSYDSQRALRGEIFKDGGQKTATNAITGTGGFSSVDSFFLGHRANLTNTVGCNGTIAYALVYNRALTIEEVRRNHAALRIILKPRGISLA